MSRLGVIGGTFDPVHYGHLVLAESAREQLSLDTVVFVPANFPWRKADREIAPAEDRYAMLHLATADNPGFGLSDIEIRRGGPSYTADTLEAVAASNAGAELFFLLGEDALQDLPNWRDPDRIIAAATLAVAGRPGASPAPPPAALAERVVRVEMPAIGITATGIRERVWQGRSVRYLTPDVIIEYISAHHLYQ